MCYSLPPGSHFYKVLYSGRDCMPTHLIKSFLDEILIRRYDLFELEWELEFPGDEEYWNRSRKSIAEEHENISNEILNNTPNLKLYS